MEEPLPTLESWLFGGGSRSPEGLRGSIPTDLQERNWPLCTRLPLNPALTFLSCLSHRLCLKGIAVQRTVPQTCSFGVNCCSPGMSVFPSEHCSQAPFSFFFFFFFFIFYYTLSFRVHVHNMQVRYICIHVPCWCAAPINSSFSIRYIS